MPRYPKSKTPTNGKTSPNGDGVDRDCATLDGRPCYNRGDVEVQQSGQPSITALAGMAHFRDTAEFHTLETELLAYESYTLPLVWPGNHADAHSYEFSRVNQPGDVRFHG